MAPRGPWLVSASAFGDAIHQRRLCCRQVVALGKPGALPLASGRRLRLLPPRDLRAVRPPGTLIARWYCPKARRTVSALPDCLAPHYSGTLADLEAMVLAVEQAPSRALAAEQLRTEIELPGALRYLDRLCASVHDALSVIRGLEPVRFAEVAPTLQAFAQVLGAGSILARLRGLVTRYLPHLPIPFGFVLPTV